MGPLLEYHREMGTQTRGRTERKREHNWTTHPDRANTGQVPPENRLKQLQFEYIKSTGLECFARSLNE